MNNNATVADFRYSYHSEWDTMVSYIAQLKYAQEKTPSHTEAGKWLASELEAQLQSFITRTQFKTEDYEQVVHYLQIFEQNFVAQIDNYVIKMNTEFEAPQKPWLSYENPCMQMQRLNDHIKQLHNLRWLVDAVMEANK